MKRLKVEYDNIVLFDRDVDQVLWNDNPNGITVTGKIRSTSSGSGGTGALMSLLSAAARRPSDAAPEPDADPQS